MQTGGGEQDSELNLRGIGRSLLVGFIISFQKHTGKNGVITRVNICKEQETGATLGFNFKSTLKCPQILALEK